MKNNKDYQKVIYDGKVYAGFWKGILSNFHIHPHKSAAGDSLHSSEQSFMLMKARHFKDTEMERKILNSKTPQEAKNYGRKVANFDEDEWSNICMEYMYSALYDKFTSSDELKELLLSTGNATLVEASPYDLIWGVGIGLDKEWYNEDLWAGYNCLGELLEELRGNLREDN